MTYISFKELKFDRSHKTGAKNCVDSDKTITVKTEDISAVFEEKMNYTYEVYCEIALSNGYKFSITKSTGDTIRELLQNLTTDISKRGADNENNSIKTKSLIEWASIDDACDVKKDGTIVSYHCTDNGIDELDYIIERLRTLYAAGGAVEKITIEASK